MIGRKVSRISVGILIGGVTIIALSRQAAGAAPLRPIDDARAAAAGVRKLEGRHLMLYTDVASDREVDSLPAVFDQAVPQWAEYFGVPERQVRDWQARAFLIRDRERFDALGLMPTGHDHFEHGFSMGREFWLYDQPTAYYRRHLLLHEGTHVFMLSFLGSCGPGWYMEGTAELMATHRLDDATGRLTLRTMPQSREEVPMLGRIKLIEDAREAGRVLTLPAVLQIDSRRQLGTEAYAWTWAAAKFLDSHPRYGERFRSMQRHVLDPQFNDAFRRAYAEDWEELSAEWRAVVATLDHGYDFERMTIEFRRSTPLSRLRREVTIAADRGWQSSGVWLEAGRSYHVTASGRYQIAAEETGGVTHPWPCEPGGVTIEYHDGRPLGMLLGAVEPGAGSRERRVTDTGGFADPIAIGLERTITPAASGTLYLRVNDSGGRLDDNRGELTVVVEAAE